MTDLSRVRVIANLIWSGAEVASSILVSLVALLGIARLIGATEFGLGVLALGIAQIFSVVLGSLFHDALVQTSDAGQKRFDAAWTASWILGLGVFGLCLALAEPLSIFFDEPRFRPVFIALAPMLAVDGAASILMAERRRHMDFRTVALQHLTSRALGALVGVAMAWSGAGVWSVAAQQLITSIGLLILLWVKVPVHPRLDASFRTLVPLIRFTGPIITTQFVIEFGERVILAYIAKIGGVTVAGYWGLATRFVDNLTRAIHDALYHVALSYFAKAKDTPVELGRLVRQANAWLAALALPALATLAMLSEDVIRFLLGDDWLAAAPATQWLAVGAMIQIRRLMDHVAINALGRPDLPLWAYVLESAAMAGALFLAMPEALVVIAALRAARPLIGYVIIVFASIRMTLRGPLQDIADWAKDVLIVLATVGCLHVTREALMDGHPMILFTAAATVALLAGGLASVILRPKLAGTALAFLVERVVGASARPNRQ